MEKVYKYILCKSDIFLKNVYKYFDIKRYLTVQITHNTPKASTVICLVVMYHTVSDML